MSNKEIKKLVRMDEEDQQDLSKVAAYYNCSEAQAFRIAIQQHMQDKRHLEKRSEELRLCKQQLATLQQKVFAFNSAIAALTDSEPTATGNMIRSELEENR